MSNACQVSACLLSLPYRLESARASPPVWDPTKSPTAKLVQEARFSAMFIH